MKRRSFLKLLGLAPAACVLPSIEPEPEPFFCGILDEHWVPAEPYSILAFLNEECERMRSDPRMDEWTAKWEELEGQLFAPPGAIKGG